MDNGKTTIFHGITLLSYCGGGAYGDVYFGRDISGRTEAVKIISKKKYGNGWERELKGVIHYRKLTGNDPRLLQIYHVEEDDDTFFYTMEPADSLTPDEYKPDTLARRLDHGPLPESELFTILSSIFHGIKTIHHAGLAHRDIKPDNILFVHGQPKLGDIGLMSSLSASMTQLAGTLDFLPPEQKTDEGNYNKTSGQKSDLYAFGKVIYCAVTGELPQKYPSVPVHLGSSLEIRLFLRLAFRLCDHDPCRRPGDIVQVESELNDIERKLKYGETAADHIRQFGKEIILFLRAAGMHTISGTKKHFLIVSGAAVFFALSGYYTLRNLLFRPDPELIKKASELEHLKNDQKEHPADYVRLSFPDQCFSLDVPKTWKMIDRTQIISSITKKDKDPFTVNREKEDMRHVLALIFPNQTNGHIQIEIIPRTKDELDAIPEKDLSTGLKPFFGNEWKVISLRRLAERRHSPILFMARQNAEILLTTYIFPQKTASIAVSLYQNGDISRDVTERFLTLLDTFHVQKKEAVYSSDPDGRTPFMMAVSNLNFKAGEQLLKKGADPDARAFGGSTALHFAVKDSQTNAAEFLLSRAVNPNIPDDFGLSPLHYAAHRGYAEIVRLLLKNHADPEQRDTQGFTALAHAVSGEQRECVKILLEAGANPNITVHNDLKTPLIMLAVVQNDPLILRDLLTHKMNVQSVNDSGENALLRVLDIAIVNHQTEKRAVAKILIESGIEVNQANKKGQTALMYAAALADHELIRLLLDHGAKKDAKDTQGHTASDFCDGNKAPDCKKLLSIP